MGWNELQCYKVSKIVKPNTAPVTGNTVKKRLDAKYYLESGEIYNESGFSINGKFKKNKTLKLYNCSNFTLKNFFYKESEIDCIVLFNCKNFTIKNIFSLRSKMSVVLIVGDSFNGIIERVIAVKGEGVRNSDSSVHINHCSPRIERKDIPHNCHEALPISQKIQKPSDIVIKNSLFARNRSQGVYIEGGVRINIIRCCLASNKKEGVCFDWGCVRCLIRRSFILKNGHRRDIDKMDIDVDFLHNEVILEDGSSAAKVPGIAIDNGAYNSVEGNILYKNSGGAIKLVRACYGTSITGNISLLNTLGGNRCHQYEWLKVCESQDPLGEFKKGGLLDLGKSYETTHHDNYIFEFDKKI